MKYKVTFRDKKFIVDAESHSEAATMVANKLRDNAEQELEKIPLEARTAIRNNPGDAKNIKAEYLNKMHRLVHSQPEPIKGKLLEKANKIAKDLQGFIDFKDAKVADAKKYIKKGLVEFVVNDTHKAYAIASVGGFNEHWNEKGLRQHASMAIESADYVKELERQGFKEDSHKAYLKDAYPDYKNLAEYGWRLGGMDLVHGIFHSALDVVAGKYSNEEQFYKAFASEMEKEYKETIEKVKAEFDKIIATSRKNIDDAKNKVLRGDIGSIQLSKVLKQ